MAFPTNLLLDGPGLYEMDGQKVDMARHRKLFWCDTDDIYWLAERMDLTVDMFKKHCAMQQVPFKTPHWQIPVAHSIEADFRTMRLIRRLMDQHRHEPIVPQEFIVSEHPEYVVLSVGENCVQ